MLESGRVPGKGRIRASVEKLSRRVPKIVESGRLLEKSKICANTGNLSGGVLENGRIIVVPKIGRIRARTEKR